MKIEANLRMAIRCAINTHNEYKENQYQRRTEAAKNLALLPKHRKKLEKAASEILRGKAITQAAYSVFSGLGIDSDGNRITDEELFIKAGGILPEKYKILSFDNIIASIAKADQAEGVRIIQSLGIHWE